MCPNRVEALLVAMGATLLDPVDDPRFVLAKLPWTKRIEAINVLTERGVAKSVKISFGGPISIDPVQGLLRADHAILQVEPLPLD